MFCQLHSVVGISRCPLHGKCAVNSAKCYICFSYRFREMYVSIASMYLSQLVSLFLCHFSASISVPSQLIDHATKLGHHCSGDKICYSRDALLSFNTSISSTSNSLCATINSLGIHASGLICIGRKSRRRNRKRILKNGQVNPIQVLISSRFPNSSTLKVSSKLNRANLITVPTLSSLFESQFSNHSLRLSLFNARSIGTSVKRSDINNFIFDHQIDVFFVVETWLKGTGDEAKIADLTPSGYATRSFPRASRGGGLAIIARSHVLQNMAFRSSFIFEHNSFELFQATLSLERGSVNFSVST